MPIQDVPVIHPAEAIDVPVARESAVDLPAAARPPARPVQKDIRWPPERADRVLTLRLVSAQGALLPGREVRLALEHAGLVPGPQTIYHRIDDDGAVLVSAANLLRPGDLDPLTMDEQQLRGLSMFSVLPGAMVPVRMLEELVATARAVSWRLGAVVQDDHGAELDGERLVKLRQSLPQAADDGAA
jgi:FtsZ-interacting cell division protein ZipA